MGYTGQAFFKSQHEEEEHQHQHHEEEEEEGPGNQLEGSALEGNNVVVTDSNVVNMNDGGFQLEADESDEKVVAVEENKGEGIEVKD